VTPYNTPVGTNVEVSPHENVIVIFEQVTAAGNTTAETVEGVPPADYRLLPPGTYYDIETTAEYTGTVTVGIYYGEVGVPPQALSLQKLVEGEWIPLDNLRIDTENKWIYGDTDSLSLFAVMYELPQATVDIDPDTLNLRSRGRWITCYIELSPGWDVRDIDLTSLRLENILPRVGPIEVGDYDSDDIEDLMVKFDRSEVQGLVEVGDNVVLTVTGELPVVIYGEIIDLPFEDDDGIRVIMPGKGKGPK
jgi:hypothetical protein